MFSADVDEKVSEAIVRDYLSHGCRELYGLLEKKRSDAVNQRRYCFSWCRNAKGFSYADDEVIYHHYQIKSANII